MAQVEQIKLTIDGQGITAPAGMLVIEAAERAGIYSPRFCHHKKLVPYAGCRMCLVEIEGMPKLMASCSLPVKEGMVVITKSENFDASSSVSIICS